MPLVKKWFAKVTGMLNQNWATISEEQEISTIYFVDDFGVCFDHLRYENSELAKQKLRFNGFELVDLENKEDYLSQICPRKVLHEGRVLVGPIYSSGKYGKW